MTNTKAKILKVSTTLFSELGYKGTSVRKIASGVGIRESALYNHFKNKEEIFLEVAKGIFTSPFSTENEDIKESAMKGKSFLQKFTMQYKLLTFDKNNENMFRLLMIELFVNKELRTLMRFDNTSTNALSTQFEKHVEFFWESIRV